MTPEELARFDGREGRRAYAAVNGKVYDFSESPRWKDGNHLQQHQAGRDLTRELEGAPHIRAVIERFPVVGHLEEEAPSAPGNKGKPLLIGVIVAIIVAALLFFLMR